MAFNAYLIFHKDAKIVGESTSNPAPNAGWKKNRAIEISDYGFGVNMPTTTSRSDGGGATVGRANFEVFTCTKNIDTASCELMDKCCKGTNIKSIVLHLFRSGADDANAGSGAVKYAMYVFENCVITKVAVSGSGEELPKESLEFNYGACEYHYQYTDHDTGKAATPPSGEGSKKPKGWSTVTNASIKTDNAFDDFEPAAPKSSS
jgi:type VI secretion system Hcp family effector